MMATVHMRSRAEKLQDGSGDWGYKSYCGHIVRDRYVTSRPNTCTCPDCLEIMIKTREDEILLMTTRMKFLRKLQR